MYRIPIFLLIDRSASIKGPNIFAQSNSVDVLIEDLSAESDLDPWLSVLTFSLYTTVHQTLSPLENLDFPPLSAGVGSSDLGSGLILANQLVNDSLTFDVEEDKPWMKPKLFIFTDGLLGDHFEMGHWDESKNAYSKVIFCAQTIPQFSLPKHVIPLSFSEIRGGSFTPYIR